MPHDGPVTASLGSGEPPPATRSTRASWRDPRLWVGLAVVAASVLIGVRVLARADDTAPVWAARGDLAAGTVLDEEDVVVHRVRFGDDVDAGLYLSADQPLPDGGRLLHGIAGGELVPASAVGTTGESGLLTVPLALPQLAVPPDVTTGSRVDIWVTVEDEASGRVRSRPLLTDVVVAAAPRPDATFGSSGDRQLVVTVDPSQARQLGRTLAAVGESSITVVGRS